MVDLVKLVPGKANFSQGSDSPAVKQFQLALAKFGYPLSGTGYFGQATDVAVTNFQHLHGLEANGVIDAATARVMQEALDAKEASGISKPLQIVVSRPLWTQAGIKLIGIHEGPGPKDNKVIIDWAKEEGGDIAKEYTHDSIPWCALFANLCLSRAGLKGTGTLWALDFAGHWPSIQLDGPAVGAFAPMVRNGGGHIIQIVGRDQNGRIMGLGGNQADQVSIEAFPLSRLNKGFWWPSEAVPPAITGISTLPIVLSDGRVSTKES
jgi:uncharacterized protein (TIGR02594 family)